MNERKRPRTHLYRFLALVLLLAAGLKAYAFFAGQSVQDGWSNDPRHRLFTIEWEVVLACFLLFGRRDLYQWVAVFLTFASFAVLSAVLGVRGVASCGCLGMVRVNPWLMFTFDVFAILALLRLHPDWLDFMHRRYVMVAAGIVAIAFTGFAAVGLRTPTDLAGVELREIGVTITRELNVGAGYAGEWRETSVEIANHRSELVRFCGGSSGCGLDVSSDGPTVIQPGAVSNVRVRFRLPGNPGEYTAAGSIFVANEAGTTTWDFPISVVGVTLGNRY